MRRRAKITLWLRKERFNKGSREKAVWLVRDGRKRISTGCGEDNTAGAMAFLADYVLRKTSSDQPSVPKYFLYFITAKAENFPVKIGVTVKHGERFRGLQTALPYEIDVLAVVAMSDFSLESKVHNKFASIRLRGEWFARSPELLAFIHNIAALDVLVGESVREENGGQKNEA